MAIKIATPSLNDPFSFISLSDPSVDVERETFDEEWELYEETGENPPLKDGDPPTVFELTPVVDVELQGKLQGVLERDGQHSWAIAYAKVGITGVQNLFDEQGRKVKVKRIHVDGYKTLVSSQVNLIGRDVMTQIGTALINHSIPKSD